jgi:Calcineurin-like phosphoesterase
MSEPTTAANGPAAPPPGGRPERRPLLDHTEAVAKLSTVALGILYVFGVLISNVQLIDLGISDFASLQARNILTGLFFVLYFAWMLIFVTLVYAIGRACHAILLVARDDKESDSRFLALIRRFDLLFVSKPAQIAAGIGVVIVLVIALAELVLSTGEYFDYIYPWGPRTLGRSFHVRDILARFSNAYLSFNNLTAGVFVMYALIYVNLLLPRLNSPYQITDSSGRQRLMRRLPLGLGFLFLTIAALTVLAGYAKDIYPNIRYNLGGGQPQVAALVFSGKRSDLAAVNTAGAPLVQLCCVDANAEQSVKIDQIVVWYQSDKFIYVSALGGIDPASPVPAHVVAMDVKLVRNIEYLPRYIEIHDGNRIAKVYQRGPDGVVSAVPPPQKPPVPTLPLTDDAIAPEPPSPAPAAVKLPLAWVQLHPDDDGGGVGQLIARAVIEDGGPCPTLRFGTDGAPPMTERWTADGGPFPIKICEQAYSGELAPMIGDVQLKPRPADPQKIVVIGDTGCRLTDWGVQDCNDAAEWPFRTIAARVAALKPDLIIHVGDYHYREACLKGDAGKCSGMALGDNWPAWRADFFAPAGDLLAAAPWIMLRGNHEDMGRAGVGWRLLLSPFPPTELPLADDARPYALRFDNLTLAILDVANSGNENGAQVRADRYVRWVDRLAARFPADPARQSWLFLHIPPWVSYKCPAGMKCVETEEPGPKNIGMNTLRSRLAADAHPHFDLAFAGDTHMFQFFAPKDHRRIPAQIVVGTGGDLLEPPANYDRTMLDREVDAELFKVAGKLWMHYGFGYLVLTKQDAAWTGALHDANGRLLLTCNLATAALDDAQNKFPCAPPAP